MFENTPLVELAIGRSTVRQRILALLIVGPGKRLHLREIQRRAGTSPGTASRELGKLVAAGLVERESEGVQVYFRAADNPVAAMMRQLLMLQVDAPVLPRPSLVARSRQTRPVEARADEPERLHSPAPEPPRLLNALPSPAAPPAAHPGALAATPVADVAVEPPVSSRSAVAAADGATVAVSAPIPDPLGLLVGARFAAAIRPLYEARLKGVYLFGLRAVGPAAEDADVELLVVLDRVDSYGEELEKTSVIGARLSVELGLVVSRVFAAHESWPGSVQGFVPVIAEEDER